VPTENRELLLKHHDTHQDSLATGETVPEHIAQRRFQVTKKKIAFHRRTPAWCRQTAEGVGPSTSEVINGLLEGSAHYQLRSAQAILALADKHGAARLEAACAKAIEAGDPAYRTIRNILAAGLEAADLPDRPGGDGGAPAFLHGPDQLFGNVIRLPLRGEDAAS
jgi:hypothetical protein